MLAVGVYPLIRIRKRLQQLSGESVANATTLITNYNEAFNGNRVVTSYSLQEHLITRMEDSLRGLFRISIKMVQRTRTLSFFAHVILSAGIAATVWLQGHLIAIGHLTPGNFVSFIAALLMLYTPLKKMGGTVNAVNLSILALERVFTRLEAVPAIQSKPNAVHLSGFRDSIIYNDVCFAYTPDRPVLKNINLKIKSGQSVAFVGNSGGGKTTLVNLLPRFYDVTSGSIHIDGLDVRDAELLSLRNLISIVFQDNFLFSGTIRENILFGRQDATAEEVDEAVHSACLSEFIETLPQGLNSEIGERGVLLSGGQKQRIAIARAFIKKSPIVILDEATSALDNKSEAIVQQAIENLMQNRTVLIIAHRLTTVIHADMIVVLDQGVIAETGTHESLFARKNGIYRSLYENQFQRIEINPEKGRCHGSSP
jgi:subfamily B ATP-binding cassette protein MsbA